MSFYFIGYVLGSIYTARVINQVGHIRSFAVLASVASVTSLAHILIIDPIGWSLFRLINGACISGLSLVIESWLNAHALPQHRAKILSISGITTVAAIGLGQFLLHLANPEEFDLFLVISIIISLSLVPISMTASVAPSFSKDVKFNLRKTFSKHPLGGVSMFIVGFTMSIYLSLGGYYAQGLNWNITQISTFMAMIMLGTLLVQYPIGWLSDRLDRRWVLSWVSGLSAVTCSGLVWATINSSNYKIFMILAFFLGAFGQPLYAITVALINDVIDQTQILITTSSLLLIFGIGSIIGPILGGWFIKYVHQAGIFVLLTAMYLILFFLGKFNILLAPHEKHRSRYSDFVSTFTKNPLGQGHHRESEKNSQTPKKPIKDTDNPNPKK